MAASALLTKEKYRIFFNINILKALIVSHEKQYNSTNDTSIIGYFDDGILNASGSSGQVMLTKEEIGWIVSKVSFEESKLTIHKKASMK